MKRVFVALAGLALVGLVGCGGGGTTGGPGADKAKQQEKDSAVKKGENRVRQAEDTFNLTAPSLATSLKQGETKEVTIGVSRGKNFEQDVSLKLDGLPKGVTAEPAAPAIKHGDADVKVRLKAADDAALGDFTVKVIGHPTKGADATNEFKLTVAKKGS